MLQAILFDVDGTLIDTYRLYLEAYRRALEPYLGYAPEDAEFIARRPSSEKRFLEDWVGPEAAAECHSSMCGHYERLHATHCEGLYDGIREMLAGLRSAGIPLGVVTGKGRHAWKITDAEFGLGDFAVVVTDDDVAEPKPSPIGLEAARRTLGIDAGEILYVGDSMADMQAGRAAGMMVGAALWPKTWREDRAEFIRQIDEFGVDFRFEHPADLVRRFAAWC